MIPFRDNIPARRYPLTTLALIAANLGIFFYELSLDTPVLESFLHEYGLVPNRLQLWFQYPVQVSRQLGFSLLSSMFLHGGWLHVLGNMWYLWIFGDNVEDRMGHLRFLFFYLLCGVLASATHIAFNLQSGLPSVGASGAVAGVLGAYLLNYPLARISTLIPLVIWWPVIELPALLVLGFWFVLQVLSVAALPAQAFVGVAFWAHIGGFLAGLFLCGLFVRPPLRRYTWRL